MANINFDLRTANEAWLIMLRDVVNYGSRSAPRGKPIREMLGYQSRIMMRYPLVTFTGRKMGFKFAAAEAAWIMAGRSDVASIAPYAKNIKNFSDDGLNFFGAYGPKITGQMSYVAYTLMDDPDSRQAVINIWRESPPKTKDVPCSLSVQFIIRNGKLHCLYIMRSSDAWLGWVYDTFNFTMISTGLLLELRRAKPDRFKNLQLGTLTLTAGSQHIYEENLEDVERILQAPHGAGQYQAYAPLDAVIEPFKSWDELTRELWNYADRKLGALQFMRGDVEKLV